ncbi:MAG: 50S ribosomal protein L25 [Acidobacteriota bacterium]|nr:50S ribosomal protein L25 [Acidobacteriota bacterium]
MSETKFEVEKRDNPGTNANRRLRAAGKIPAIVYGGGKESVPIQIDRKSVLDLLKTTGGENPIFLLKMSGTGQERHAMIRDMQVNPLTRQIIHIDFQRIEMTEKVRVQVQIELTGTAHGVKVEGGMLDFITREVHIECLPGDIPKVFELDVTELHVGQHLEAGALKLPPGVILLDEPDRLIVSLTHSRTEAEEGVVEGAGGAEPEVIKRGKPEEA